MAYCGTLEVTGKYHQLTTVVEGKKLTSKEMFGDQDPYVKLQIDS
jgi:hypothetical protein